MSRNRVRYTGMADSLFLSIQETRRAIAQEEAAAAAPTIDTNQTAIQTRLDLESSRPFIIAAIRRTQGQPVQRRLVGIRDLLDAAIDDLYHEQKAEGVAA